MTTGKLILVPTPIGNLGDITLRAIEALKDAELILAEDTRKTGILLSHFGIRKKLLSHHKFNEHKSLERVLSSLEQGMQLALVTDAGTPAVSDPGFLLLRACIKKDIPVECLPGPTALIPALVLSGIDATRFCFEGFLPHKKGRMTRMKELSGEPRTLIFYESPHRIIKTLDQLSEHLGPDRKAAIARELTKIHETIMRGTLSELSRELSQSPVKGEFVLVVEGAGKHS